MSIERRWLVILSLLFILFRLIFLQQYTQKNPFYAHPVLDSAFYLQWSDAIRDDRTFFAEEYHHPPGYAFFLALVGGNLYAVLFLQSLMIAAQGFLVFEMSRRIGGIRSAWLAFILFSLTGPIVFYSMKILSETLFSTLLLLSCFLLIRYFQDDRLRNLFFSGLFLGGAIEVRGNAVVYLIPAFLAILILQKKSKVLLVYCLGTAICILPVLARNLIVAKSATAVASNWGENFYMANNRSAGGTFSPIPGVRPNLRDQIQDVKTEASRRTGRKMNSLQAQGFWFREGLRFIKQHPGDWVRLEGLKLHKLVSRQEASTIYFYDLETKYFQPSLRLLFINYGWILPLFLLGLAFLNSSREAWIVVGFIAAHLVLLLIFWPELRFVLPIIPFSLVLAGNLVHPRISKIRAVVAIAAVAAWGVANLNAPPGTGGREAWYTNASSAYFANNEYDKALQMAKTAIQINPRYADAWVNLGSAFYALGQKVEARNAWSEALRLQPGHPVALRNLGLSSRLMPVGDLTESPT